MKYLVNTFEKFGKYFEKFGKQISQVRIFLPKMMLDEALLYGLLRKKIKDINPLGFLCHFLTP